jgi:hypothetical protein
MASACAEVQSVGENKLAERHSPRELPFDRHSQFLIHMNKEAIGTAKPSR